MDEPKLVLSTISTLLHSLGYGVIQATNGRKALQLAEKEQPDAILLDAIMLEWMTMLYILN